MPKDYYNSLDDEWYIQLKNPGEDFLYKTESYTVGKTPDYNTGEGGEFSRVVSYSLHFGNISLATRFTKLEVEIIIAAFGLGSAGSWEEHFQILSPSEVVAQLITAREKAEQLVAYQQSEVDLIQEKIRKIGGEE